jgi:hypothetical protein
MMPIRNFALRLLRGGRRMIGALAAAALLVPLPAMALTFTGPWQAFTNVSGGPTPTTPTFTDVTNGGTDDLVVDMKDYQGATAKAASIITLVRPIEITSASEAVDFAHQFAADFKQGGVVAAVGVFDGRGNLVAAPITFAQQTRSTTFTPIGADQSVTETFSKGNYFLGVGVIYFTNNKIGGWKEVSKHHFEIEGL